VPGGAINFASAYRFDSVIEARATWDTHKAKLTQLLNIAAAVGLSPATKERPAVLVFARDFALARCKERGDELKAAYPDYAKSFVRKGLPEAILPRLTQAVRRQYEHLLEPARAEVVRQLRQVNGREEARWKGVRAWLKQPDELLPWRELVRVLAQLSDTIHPDPVSVLQEFLAEKQITIKVQSILVEIPELRSLKPRAEARLTIQHPNTTLTFEQAGEPTLDTPRRVRVYTYRLVEGKVITYRPGEKLWAELPLAGGKERLVWSQSRSNLWQFERLRQPPRLQSTTATSLEEGRVLEDVRLMARPEEGVVTVPDLVPRARFDE
jgi:hypothetical protein